MTDAEHTEIWIACGGDIPYCRQRCAICQHWFHRSEMYDRAWKDDQGAVQRVILCRRHAKIAFRNGVKEMGNSVGSEVALNAHLYRQRHGL